MAAVSWMLQSPVVRAYRIMYEDLCLHNGHACLLGLLTPCPGLSCMQAKSKPMREILGRLTAGGEFEMVEFGDQVWWPVATSTAAATAIAVKARGHMQAASRGAITSQRLEQLPQHRRMPSTLGCVLPFMLQWGCLFW